MPRIADIVRGNWSRVRDRVAAACLRAHRPAESVEIVAVSKYAEVEWMRALLNEGVRHLGESRPQQLIGRAAQLDHDIHWHLIGPLQRNKVRAVLPAVALIHSVDSLKLLEQISRVALELGLAPRVLLEVNVSGEGTKHGFSPTELRAVWSQIIAQPEVRVAGLMTMAPHGDNPEDARPVFAGLRDLRDELQSGSPPGVVLSELSMGMSGDAEVGIEEGATLVRVGSALWEGLPGGPPAP